MQQGSRRSQLKVAIPEKKTNFELWYIVRKLFHRDDIDDLNNLIEPIGITTATTVGETEGYRDSVLKWLPDCDDTKYKWIYNRLWKWSKIANDDNWHFELGGWKDTLQYTYYPDKGGHYDWHTDIGGPGINHRKVSGTVLLKKPEEGGDLQFMCGRDAVTIDLEEGDAVFFPSWYLHRVTPVVKGERESLVSWISGQPYR